MINEKRETRSFRRTIRLAPSIGDWTTLKPPKIEAKKIRGGLQGFNRLSEAELKEVHLLHYHLAQKMLGRLRQELQIAGELYSISAEQLSYMDFIKRSTQPLAQFKIAIPGFGEVTLSIELALASTIINYALGSKNTPSSAKPLTELEETTLTSTLSEILEDFTHQFKDVSEPLKLEFVGSPLIMVDPALNPSDAFSLFTIELSLGQGPYKISMGYPYTLIKNLLKKFRALPEERPLPLFKLKPPLLEKVLVPAVVNLGNSTIKTKDLKELETGDVVAIDTSLDSLIPILIGKDIRLWGQSGIKEGKLAVRVGRLRKRIPPPEKVPEAKILEEAPKPKEAIVEEEAIAPPLEEEETHPLVEEEEEYEKEEEEEEYLFGEEEEEEEI